MPRMPRLALPGITHHVVQRGNNRQPCFFDASDRIHYLGCLREMALRHACRVHAYVLMDNHVHLLVTPEGQGALSTLMQSVGRNYVRHLNDRIGRTGTLWEGRYRAGPVDSERYVLACMRYIELNPVRAGMVASPADYRWSSYRHHGNALENGLLTSHACYLALGESAQARATAYRAMLDVPLSDPELGEIRIHVQRQRALGSSEFQDRIERQVGHPVRLGKPGRPAGEIRRATAEAETEGN